MMRTALVLVACVACVAMAQIPAHCASPKEWEGRAMVRDSRRGHREVVYADYFYDETNKRKARFDKVEVNRTVEYYQVIELFNEKTYYAVNLRTKQCEKGTIDYPFITHSVLTNATFQGDFIIGSNAVEGAGVEIELWDSKFTHNGKQYNWNGQFTRVGCLPVVTNVDTAGEFWSETFIDLTLGIRDPNVFVPPSNCQ